MRLSQPQLILDIFDNGLTKCIWFLGYYMHVTVSFLKWSAHIHALAHCGLRTASTRPLFFIWNGFRARRNRRPSHKA